MKSISLEGLLEAGCHFGHQVTRQNPKARDYVFEERDNIHIIDLEKTKEGLEEAATVVKNVASKPDSTMVILGAKRQAQEIVKSEVVRAKAEGGEGLYFVTNRWIGGIFTNFQEVAKNFRRLSEIDKLFADEYEKARYTKKELLLMEREKQKLMSFYSGIKDMKKIPDLIYIIDTHLEDLAVREAKAMDVKVVGITDTNADPTIIDYAIPANDDAVGSIQLITSYIVDAWIEGKKIAAKSAPSASSGQGEHNAAEKAKIVEESIDKGTKGTEEPKVASTGDETKEKKDEVGVKAAAQPAYKQSAAGREKDQAKRKEVKGQSAKSKEVKEPKAIGPEKKKKE